MINLFFANLSPNINKKVGENITPTFFDKSLTIGAIDQLFILGKTFKKDID